MKLNYPFTSLTPHVRHILDHFENCFIYFVNKKDQKIIVGCQLLNLIDKFREKHCGGGGVS